MAKLRQFLEGHPKPVFSVKVQRGDQGKFLKNRQKVAFVSKAQKHTGANGVILNLCAFNEQTLENILAQTAAPKVPEWPSYGNFCEFIQNPRFLKKCKGGTKGNFSKIAQKEGLAEKAQKHCGVNAIIL